MIKENSEKYLERAGAKIDQSIESIFKIATGTLALSITFKGSLTSGESSCLWLLAIAWISLALVPVSYVFFKLCESEEDLFWHAISHAAPWLEAYPSAGSYSPCSCADQREPPRKPLARAFPHVPQDRVGHLQQDRSQFREID